MLAQWKEWTNIQSYIQIHLDFVPCHLHCLHACIWFFFGASIANGHIYVGITLSVVLPTVCLSHFSFAGTTCVPRSTADIIWYWDLFLGSIFTSNDWTDVLFSSPEPKAQVSYCHSAPSVVRPSVNFHIFDFSSETAERNSKKLDRKQDLNALYQVCVFRADGKNKMAALASDWLRHFELLLWNRWMEFNESWQEARSQHPLPSLCFSGRSEKKDGRPGLWLAETFWTSPLKPLNGIQRNLTGSKISKPSTKFVFFGRIGKKDGRPGFWLAETFSTSPLKPLNRIQWNLIGSKISKPST